MRTVRAVAELREALAAERGAGRSIALVPTMGYFHEGHLSLMRQAREQSEVVVVSLFVNPAQFGPNEDLDAYPRDEVRDSELAERHGVDVLFAPPVEEVYPDGFATTVAVHGLTEVLDGHPARRGQGHFDGVTTVVTQRFTMAHPRRAWVGRRNTRRTLAVTRPARALSIPARSESVPPAREPDGLALSSRNVYLSPEERE